MGHDINKTRSENNKDVLYFKGAELGKGCSLLRVVLSQN